MLAARYRRTSILHVLHISVRLPCISVAGALYEAPGTLGSRMLGHSEIGGIGLHRGLVTTCISGKKSRASQYMGDMHQRD